MAQLHNSRLPHLYRPRLGDRVGTRISTSLSPEWWTGIRPSICSKCRLLTTPSRHKSLLAFDVRGPDLSNGVEEGAPHCDLAPSLPNPIADVWVVTT